MTAPEPTSEDFPVTDEMVDRASEDSFPASDPPAYSIPAAGLGRPRMMRGRRDEFPAGAGDGL